MSAKYPAAIGDLIDNLRRLPGIGPRGAERIALWLVADPARRTPPLLAAIGATTQIAPCPLCGFFTTGERCAICADPARAAGALCVVEQATDIILIERTDTFNGRYHALGGRLSPLDHVGPDDLRIGTLLDRVQTERPGEVILALAADVEGEATAGYLAALLQAFPCRVTRIAQGLPVGGGLEHADRLTLSRALDGRREFAVP